MPTSRQQHFTVSTFPFSPGAGALAGLLASFIGLGGCGGGDGNSGGSGGSGTGGTVTTGGSGGSTGGTVTTGGSGGSTGGSHTGGNTTGGGGAGGGNVFDPASCGAAEVRCVDDDPGPTAEYATIQEAVDVANPGDSVLVFAGGYAGFRVNNSGTKGAPIAVRAESGVSLTGPEAATHNFIRIAGASYVVVEGFHIAGTGQPQPYDYNYACIAARDASPEAPMHGLVFRNNDVSGCSPSGMYLSEVEGLLLEGNDIHDNVLEAENGNGNGVYLANAGTDNVVVRGNRFVGNAGSGIHFNGDISVGGDGIQTGHLFEGNVVADNGANGFNMDGVQDAVFVNNVFANNGRHGVRGFDIDAAEGPRNNVFINNTFYGNAGAGVKMSEDSGGHVIFNVLFVANVEGGFVIEETTPMTSNNLDVSSPNGVFAGAGSGDFHLAAGSPAIDAGISAFAGHSAPASDLSGAPRDATPDLGAFESGGN